MKIAVYTCITDAYDPLYPPACVDQRLDYFYFSERPSNVVEPWKFKRIDLPYLNAKDQNRYVKMHPHKVLPEYDVTLYIDGSIQIVGDIYEMVTKALQLEGDIFLYDHHERNCIYSEAAACAHCSHDWIWTIARQMRRYSREGYPVNNGLYEAGVILRRNTDRVSKIMEYWWIEYSQGVKRDQLLLPYVLWKLGVSISSMGKSDHRFTHRYLRFVNHPQRRRSLSLISKYIINRSVAAIVPYNRLFSIKQLVRFVPTFMKPALKKIFYVPALKKIFYLPIDVIDRMKGRDRMIPPRSMIFVGDGDFEKIGHEFKNYFIELANLQPNHRVLDVGCGIGRMAIPLTNYLSEEGEYCGFDIVKVGIDWCQKRISSTYDNFHFQHIDVHNKNYNPKGKILAKDFQFPFESESFDFVFLTSVFTHMLPSDLKNYLSEISRVLKQDGKCFITFFLLNEESTNLIRTSRSTLDFRDKIEGCLTIDASNPESAIAYDEYFIKKLFWNFKLKIIQPIQYGSWCKRDNYLSYQDIIVATKEKSNGSLISTNTADRAVVR